jgi:molybdate transport system substrate-binding protein
MKLAWRVGAGVVIALVSSVASANEIRLLSAGAVQIGLEPVLAEFEHRTGDVVHVSYAAAPAIAPRLAAEPGFDLVIAPQAVLDALASAGTIGAERVTIGKVGIGVAIRASATAPDLSSVEALKQALLGADAVVFNRASTGLHVEKMLKSLGLGDVVDAKAVRVDDGAAVMRRLLAGTGAHEFGFAAMTEIVLFEKEGVKRVGPLPAALQNETTYLAAPVAVAGSAASANRDVVQALLSQLRSVASRAAFASAGIAAAP